MEQFKSPRKVEEELQQYKYKRFDRYMALADDQILPRALAIAAFKSELEYNILLGRAGNENGRGLAA